MGFRVLVVGGTGQVGSGLVRALGRLVPGSFGTIDQDDIGRAFVGEFLRGRDGTTILENAAMKQRSQAL